MVRSLIVAILYYANLYITNLRSDEIVFFGNLKKIDTDENKAIHSSSVTIVKGCDKREMLLW